MIGKIIFPKRDETKQTGGSMMAIILPKDLRPLVVLSHNRIEDTSKSEHKILPDEKYDLIHIKTEETIKTVKGSTIIKYAKRKEYNILNILSSDRYLWRKPQNINYPQTIAEVDFTQQEAIIKDLGLNDIKLEAEKLADNKLIVSVNGRTIEISWETKHVPYVQNISERDEENIVSIMDRNVLRDRYSIGYHGKVDSVVLKTLNGMNTLIINHITEEPGPTKKIINSIDL